MGFKASVAPSGLVRGISRLLLNPQGVALRGPVRPLRGGMRVSGQPLTREGVLRQIVTKALPPASRFNPAFPRDLEGVLNKATARDPDDRYPTAIEFATDLRRWLDGKSVAALPYSGSHPLGTR